MSQTYCCRRNAAGRHAKWQWHLAHFWSGRPIYCSYFQLIDLWYWIFRHSFLKHLAFSYLSSDLIENLYTGQTTCWSSLVRSVIRLHSPDTNLWPIKNCAIFWYHPIYYIMNRKAWFLPWQNYHNSWVVACLVSTSFYADPPLLLSLSKLVYIQRCWIWKTVQKLVG